MDADALMFADIMSDLAKGEQFFYPIGELSEPMIWAPLGIFQDFAKILHQAGAQQVSPLDIVFGQYLLATPEDPWPILKQLYQVFGGQIWAWEVKPAKKNAPTLVKMKELAYRVMEDWSFIWVTPLITIWPPPFTTGLEQDHDLTWCIVLEEKHPESEVIWVLVDHLKGEAVGACFVVVHPLYSPVYLPADLDNKDGSGWKEPTHIIAWLKSSSTGLIKEVKMWRQCCLCWRNESHSAMGAHFTLACPMIQSFNKMRAHKALHPLEHSYNFLSATLKKESVMAERLKKQMDDEVKAMRGLIGALDKQVLVLEQGKRKSMDSSPAATSSKKKKKEKQANVSAGQTSGQLQSSGSGQQMQNKGKGKAKAQGKGNLVDKGLDFIS
ncbi:hypothetical protein BJV74DRAFT_800123 [Russula compacta]|nr:hypothetical protein BJV74DRAFT_800123 [Russula compacta]